MIFLPPNKLGDLIDSYITDGKALRQQIAEICTYAKGAVEYNTAWGMSFEDREFIIKSINKRIKEQNPKGKEYM